MTDDTPSAVVEPPWWRPSRATGRRRQPLSRELIIEAAVRILDAEGADALTVRRLGEELDTGSATLYWYVGSKDELGELVYDHVMGEVELPEPDPDRWQDQIKQLGRQAYRVMLRHNDAVRLSLGRVPVGPNMLRIMEWSLELFRRAGIDERAASFFGDIFGRYLDASVLEVTAHGGPPVEQVGAYFQSLPPDRFPNVAALAATMTGGDDDERFEFGLDLLVRGLETYVSEERKSRDASPRTRTRRSSGRAGSGR
ncbi:MAG TPA: TetR/AcrR family transcriptional regulator [Acidimicrobiia bacterium]